MAGTTEILERLCSWAAEEPARLALSIALILL